jgi:uncharacterized protein affecting Mg2+/Co2+ transport
MTMNDKNIDEIERQSENNKREERREASVCAFVIIIISLTRYATADVAINLVTRYWLIADN